MQFLEQPVVELVPHKLISLMIAKLSQIIIKYVMLLIEPRISPLALLALVWSAHSTAILQTAAVLPVEISGEQDLVIILGGLLAASNEAENGLLLLHGDGKDAAACLEVVLELLMEVERRLDLDEGAEFGVVVLDVVATLLILLDEGVLPAHGNVVDADIGVVAAA